MYLAKDYVVILEQLRALLLLANYNLQAYIVPSGDAHYTEFIAECHQRRAYVSGFTGSAGTAIVTNDTALLWTDGRYFLQAERELDDKLWTLMRDGTLGTPSQAKWLQDNLAAGSRVGVDPTLYSKRQWDSMEQELKSVGITLVPINDNLIDEIWADRPTCSSDPIINLGLEFAGKPTSNKVADIRQQMKENSASLLVVTELDEVAWLLNLRGNDIPYSSTFFAYVIVAEKEFHLFVNPTQLTSEINATLIRNVPEIQIHKYEDISEKLKDEAEKTETEKVWFNQNTNYALVSLIPADKQIMKLTPISLMKATKNPTEVIGYRNALLRDAAALCEFFAWIEAEMNKGTRITEISAAEKLHSFRKQRENFFNDSFPTISAAGEHGSVIHYMPTPETDRQIQREDMYLLDSGGLYRDGTTDITRTLHFGVPTPHQKNCYTRVLKGQIALATAIFPNRMVGSRLDSFARQFLWEVGLDYNHGTGHGVGSFLNVHEGPFSIGGGYSSTDPGLRENFFTSNEPGYYEDNEFGIRLENVIRVKNASLDHNFQNIGFIGFEDLTLVPYEHKLIDFSLLTEEELDYLNKYQEAIRKHVGGYIRANEMSEEAYEWMMRSTVPIDDGTGIDPTTGTPTSTEGSPTPTTTEGSPTPTTTEGSTTVSSSNGMRLNIFLLAFPVLAIITKTRVL